MHILTTEHSFDSAHFLHEYSGKCSNIHGHRWNVEIEVFSESLKAGGQERGMVVDFGVLKRDFRALIDSYDHALIIESASMREDTLSNLKRDGFNVIEVMFRPTAEEFSKFFFDEMKARGYAVKRIRVFETPNNSAIYEEWGA